MPLFDYMCDSCAHEQEHFCFDSSIDRICPKCSSEKYIRQLSAPSTNVEYGNPQENYHNKIEKHVRTAYENMGREALDGDTKTVDNVFGGANVDKTFSSEG